jgi:hypothetical protein
MSKNIRPENLALHLKSSRVASTPMLLHQSVTEMPAPKGFDWRKAVPAPEMLLENKVRFVTIQIRPSEAKFAE